MEMPKLNNFKFEKKSKHGFGLKAQCKRGFQWSSKLQIFTGVSGRTTNRR